MADIAASTKGAIIQDAHDGYSVRTIAVTRGVSEDDVRAVLSSSDDLDRHRRNYELKAAAAQMRRDGHDPAVVYANFGF